jgi:hypothetical protein
MEQGWLCEPRPDSSIVVARAHTISRGTRMPNVPHWSAPTGWGEVVETGKRFESGQLNPEQGLGRRGAGGSPGKCASTRTEGDPAKMTSSSE